MSTIEYATFRYDTVEVENGVKRVVLSYGESQKRNVFVCVLHEIFGTFRYDMVEWKTAFIL